jgi:hypothetical protein
VNVSVPNEYSRKAQAMLPGIESEAITDDDRHEETAAAPEAASVEMPMALLAPHTSQSASRPSAQPPSAAGSQATLVQGSAIAPRHEPPTTIDTAILVHKSGADFSQAECYTLLFHLENELRRLIVHKLSALTPAWWKQRIPPDVRKQAEEIMARNRGDASGMRPGEALHDFLDFSHYQKILIMKLNWDEVFKSVFQKEGKITYVLSEIGRHRIQIAHMRPLRRPDREEFVTYARSLLVDIEAALNTREPSQPVRHIDTA